MPKLPQLSAAELERALRSMGFERVSQRGSHIKLRDANGRTATVPNHKSIKPGTLKKGILNPLGISVEELITHLRK
jgi:predicted RNA binding protein YcfA (HicA-like mRNA interferase family)